MPSLDDLKAANPTPQRPICDPCRLIADHTKVAESKSVVMHLVDQYCHKDQVGRSYRIVLVEDEERDVVQYMRKYEDGTLIEIGRNG